jgi:hypothetical protein
LPTFPDLPCGSLSLEDITRKSPHFGEGEVSRVYAGAWRFTPARR